MAKLITAIKRLQRRPFCILSTRHLSNRMLPGIAPSSFVFMYFPPLSIEERFTGYVEKISLASNSARFTSLAGFAVPHSNGPNSIALRPRSKKVVAVR